MDVMTEVLKRLRLKGQLYGRLEFSAPWGFEFPGGKGICLMVVRGSCFLGVDSEDLCPLAEGDFVFLPSPMTYSLRSRPDIPLRSVQELISDDVFRTVREITYHGGGPSTLVIAGCFTFETPESEWLVNYLPAIIHVSGADTCTSPWFRSTLQFLATEIAQNLPGSSVIVDRLAEVLFVQAMRVRIQFPSDDTKPSWLRGLADPQIGEALQHMITEIDRPWTVPELARTVSMSRSAFAARFREVVGETPIDYLTHWRMVRAASIMRDNPSIKLAAIAASVGYSSESAFGKVFHRVMCLTPGQYRQIHPSRREG